MRYEILGPLRVVDGESIRLLNAQKVEVLLATLLTKPDHLMSIDQLLAELWPENQPRRALAALYVYVSKLRKFLKRPGLPSGPIVTRPRGYVLSLGDDEVDHQIFEQLLRQGRAHVLARRHEEAVVVLRRARELWRGMPFGSISKGPILGSFSTWLDQARLECVEMETSSSLVLGRQYELVPFLYSLISEYPLHEMFYGQLMVALCRCERRADALRVYQSARSVLMEELGVEPGRSLRNLQHWVLTAEEGEAGIQWKALGRLDLGTRPG